MTQPKSPKTQSESKGLDLKAPCGFGILSALFLPLCRSEICICLVPDYFAIVWDLFAFGLVTRSQVSTESVSCHSLSWLELAQGMT